MTSFDSSLGPFQATVRVVGIWVDWLIGVFDATALPKGDGAFRVGDEGGCANEVKADGRLAETNGTRCCDEYICWLPGGMGVLAGPDDGRNTSEECNAKCCSAVFSSRRGDAGTGNDVVDEEVLRPAGLVVLRHSAGNKPCDLPDLRGPLLSGWVVTNSDIGSRDGHDESY